MPNPLDWHHWLLPLQDFDNRGDIPHLTQMGGVRIHEPSARDPYSPDQRDTLGSVWGAFLVREAQAGARSYVPLWFLGGAGYVQTEEASNQGGTSPAGVTRPRGKSGQAWQPELKGYEPDTRLEPADVKPPDWAARQKFPAGYPAVVTQGTQEHEQNLHLHPAMWGLFAVNDGGDPQCGTLVHELDDKGKPELSQHLQSIFSVVDLGGGACGAGGKAIGLTLAKSKQDGLSGHLPLVEWLGPPPGQFIQPGQIPQAAGKITALAGLPGGSPLHTGGRGDVHRVGTDADGDPIHLPHFNPEATLWKIHEGDGPQKFSPENWQPTEDLPGVWVETFQRWKFLGERHSACGGSWPGRWAWQTKTPIFEPPKKEDDPEPKGDPKPPRVEDPPPFVQPDPEIPDTIFGQPIPPGRGVETGGGTGVLPGTFFGGPINVEPRTVGTAGALLGNTDVGVEFQAEPLGSGIGSAFDGGSPTGGRTLVGETNPDPRYAAIANCLIAYGGLAIASPSHLAGQEDFTGKGTLSSDDIKLIAEAPVTGIFEGYAGQFTWDDMPQDDTFANPRLHAPSSVVEPLIVVKPVGYAMQDVLDGDTSRKAGLCIPDSGKMVFGPPSADGTLKSVIAIEPDGAGDADVATYDASGTRTKQYSLSAGGTGGGGTGSGSFDDDVDDGQSGTVGVTVGRKSASQLLDETTDGSGGTMTTAQLAPTGSVVTGVITKVYGEPNGTGYTSGESYSVGISSDTNKYGQSANSNVGTTTDYTDYTADPRFYVTGSGATDGTITISASAFQYDGTGAQILVIVFYETSEFQ